MITYDYEPKGQPLASADRWFAHELLHKVGPTAAAELIGVSRATLTSVVSGLPCYPATAAKFRRARKHFKQNAA